MKRKIGVVHIKHHIKALCRENNIRLTQSESGFFHSLKRRAIWIPNFRSVKSYAKALHEIGHILTYDRDDGVLELEGNAWWWALQEFESKNGYIDRMFCCVMTTCLKEYFRVYAGKKGVRIPNSKHVFWDMMRMKNGGTQESK